MKRQRNDSLKKKREALEKIDPITIACYSNVAGNGNRS